MGNERMTGNSILFVGNGIDLLAGYKTDYPSFLEYYKDHYSVILKKCVSKNVKELNFNSFLSGDVLIEKDQVVEDVLIEKDQVVEDVLYGTNGYINTLIHKNLSYKSLISSDDRFLFSRESFIDDILGNKLLINNNFIKKEDVVVNRPNTWITYFISRYIVNQNMGNNWIDLEALIKENALKDSKLTYTYEKHVKEIYGADNNNDKRKIDDFYKMKVLLLEYLKSEKKKDVNEIKLESGELETYGTILNFNYSDTYCLPKRFLINQQFNSKYIGPQKIYIHGDKTSENGKKIVFGYDDGLTKDTMTFKPLVKENTKIYSKTFQLLELATYNSEKEIMSFRLPEKNSIIRIGILGHGIGEADYNYFETLVDFETVTIEVYWYYYRDELGNKTKYNNKEALNKAVVDMVHEMESRYKKVLLHKMIIEQRIVFKELEYEVIAKY